MKDQSSHLISTDRLHIALTTYADKVHKKLCGKWGPAWHDALCFKQIVEELCAAECCGFHVDHIRCVLSAGHDGEHRGNIEDVLAWARAEHPTVARYDDTSATPIPLILHCPECTERHIDEGEFETKPHHTHSCQFCGLTWRPAIVPTVGVRFLPGFKNEAARRAS